MKYVATFILLALWSMVVFVFAGCSSWTKPERADFSSDQCYRAALCAWQNMENDDTDNDLDCTGAEAECRAFDKYIFCGCAENRWQEQDEEECWRTLNQK